MSLGIMDSVRLIKTLVELASSVGEPLWLGHESIDRLRLPAFSKSEIWASISNRLTKAEFVCAFDEVDRGDGNVFLRGAMIFHSDQRKVKTSRPVLNLSRIVAYPHQFEKWSITTMPISLSIDRELIESEMNALQEASAIYRDELGPKLGEYASMTKVYLDRYDALEKEVLDRCSFDRIRAELAGIRHLPFEHSDLVDAEERMASDLLHSLIAQGFSIKRARQLVPGSQTIKIYAQNFLNAKIEPDIESTSDFILD